MDSYNIDIELLRSDLINYLSTGMFMINGGIMFDLEKVRFGTYEDVIEVALLYNIDLNNYKVYSR